MTGADSLPVAVIGTGPGVCSTSLPADADDAADSCCGSPEPVPVTIGFATGLVHGRAVESATP